MRHLLNFFATVCSLLQDRVGSVAFIPDGTKLTRGSDDATTEIGFSRRSVTCGQGLVTWLVNETFGLVLVFVTFDLNKLSKVAQSIRIMRSTKLAVRDAVSRDMEPGKHVAREKRRREGGAQS